VRALIQPLEGTPAVSGATARRGRRTDCPASSGRLRPGYGLLIAAAASLALWAGLVELVLTLLR
jgi:hypothetical protein